MKIERYETGWYWCPGCEGEYFIQRGRPDELMCPGCGLALQESDDEDSGGEHQ